MAVERTITTRNGAEVDVAFRYPSLQEIRDFKQKEAETDSLFALSGLLKSLAMEPEKISDDVVLAISTDMGEYDGAKAIRKGTIEELLYTGVVAFRKPSK